MKKNLKTFVFEKKGLVTDQEAYDFYGENLNISTLEELKTKARNYFYDLNFFKNKKIIKKIKIKRKYILEIEGEVSYQSRKEYWETI